MSGLRAPSAEAVGRSLRERSAPAPANSGTVSTHLLEFSVIRGDGGPGLAADVLVRTGARVAALFVPAEEGLGLAIVDEDELNVLEVIPTVIIPTVFVWGLVAMTLLLVAAGTLVLRRLPIAGRREGRSAEFVS